MPRDTVPEINEVGLSAKFSYISFSHVQRLVIIRLVIINGYGLQL